MAPVVGRHTEVLAWNRMAFALFGDWARLPARERNWARMVFLSPEYREPSVDWESKTSDVVSYLRLDVGVHPDDPELSVKSGVPAAVGHPRPQAAAAPAGG